MAALRHSAVLAGCLLTFDALAQAPSFDMLDADGDGRLQQDEFFLLADRIFASWDANGDGLLGEGELAAGLFTAWDADADGVLEADEYGQGRSDFAMKELPPFEELSGGSGAGIAGNEFAAAFARHRALDRWNGQDREGFGRSLFGFLDRAGDGTVSPDEHAAMAGYRFLVNGADQLSAQGPPVESGILTEGAVSLAEWDFVTQEQQGVSLLGLTEGRAVNDAQGQRIGDIWDTVLSAEGELKSFIVEIGGFWGMLPTLVNVPLRTAHLTADTLIVPLSRDDMRNYPVLLDGLLPAEFAGQQTSRLEYNFFTAEGAFRGSYLIGDYVRFPDPGSQSPDGYSRLGPIVDLMLQKDRIVAVIVAPIAGEFMAPGHYALPFMGYGLRSRATMYTVPYGLEELALAPRVNR